MLNPQTIKKDFPIFIHHPDLVYLDTAATALKPIVVIDANTEYLEQYSANISRGLYPLAELATERFETSRKKVATFIGAKSPREIIFTAGTTASLNLTAGLLEEHVRRDDNIVVTEMEHHSNYLPWKELAKKQRAILRVIPIGNEGKFDKDKLLSFIDKHTRIVAFSAVSNVLGTINPVKDITAVIKKINPKTLIVIDAAQAVGHIPFDVNYWCADFVAFSAHKMFGPTGVGVLYGKRELLETLSPVAFGGGMVLDIHPTLPLQRRVHSDTNSEGQACTKDTLYQDVPQRFEAGTQNIGGVIALAAAIQYIESIGVKNIRAHEKALTRYAYKKLAEVFGDAINILGPKNVKERGGIIAFTFRNIHPHDIAQILGEQNICVRAGEHCASPLHRALNLSATTRISFSIYNDKSDIDKLINKLEVVQKILK